MMAGLTHKEITNLPENEPITHICGGGDYRILTNENDQHWLGAGYIVFGNNSSKLYYMNGTYNWQNSEYGISFHKVNNLPVNGNVSLLSGGGNKKGFNSCYGAAIIDNNMYLFNGDTLGNTYTNIGDVASFNVGGYRDSNYGGYLLINTNEGKKLYKYNNGDTTKLEEINNDDFPPFPSGVTVNYITNKYVHNNVDENGIYSKLYYIDTNGNAHYFLPNAKNVNYASDTNASGFDNIITFNAIPSGAEILFMSGGGGYYINNNPSSGYIVHRKNSNYYLHFLKGDIAIQINVDAYQNIVAMSGGLGEFGYDNIAHGYLVTVENIPCVHKDTQVPIFVDGKIINKSISDVRSGDFVMKFDGTPIRVINNAKLYEKSKFVEILPHSLGENSPSDTLYITDGHPILFNNREILPTKINNDNIRHVDLPNVITVYTLITEERTAVKMNGVDVYTWNKEDFAKKSYNCILL